MARNYVPDPANWTLDGDAKLLECMQSMGKNLENRCKQVSDDLQQLVCRTDGTAVELGNVANRLNQLQQNQFVESRVTEDADDEPMMAAVPEKKKVSDVEATKKLLDESVQMLNKCYEKVSLDQDDESDTEDDKLRFAYRPINPYEHKRRPYIIGTKEWLEKYHIGLQSSEDDEGESDDEASETESHLTDGPQVVVPAAVVSAPPPPQSIAEDIEPIQYFIPPAPKTTVPQIRIPETRSIPINSTTVSNLFNDEPPDLDTISDKSKNFFTESDDENQNFLPVHKPPAKETVDETDQRAQPSLSQQIANQAAAAVAARKSQVSNLFEDSDDEVVPVPVPVNKQTPKQVPVPIQIPTEIEYTLRRNEPKKPVSQKVEEKITPTIPVKVSEQKEKEPTKKKITNLFEDDSDDDFFLSSVKSKKTSEVKKVEEKQPEIEKPPLIVPEPTQPATVKPSIIASAILQQKRNLFDDSEDDDDDFFKPTKSGKNEPQKYSEKIEAADERPKVEQSKVEPPKVPKFEMPKTEAKVETPKVESVKVETPKVEPSKIEIPKIQPRLPKTEAAKVEHPKVQAVKMEPPKVEPSKVDHSEVEIPKILTRFPKTEAAKVELPKVETAKMEPPKVEPTKVDHSEVKEIPKVEPRNVEKAESPKVVPMKSEPKLVVPEFFSGKVPTETSKIPEVDKVEDAKVIPKDSEEKIVEPFEQIKTHEDIIKSLSEDSITPVHESEEFFTGSSQVTTPRSETTFESLPSASLSSYQNFFNDLPPPDDVGDFEDAYNDDDFMDEPQKSAATFNPYLILDEPPPDDVVNDDNKSFKAKFSMFQGDPKPEPEPVSRPPPKKLNINFNINVGALLPGAKRPKPAESPEAKKEEVSDVLTPRKANNDEVIVDTTPKFNTPVAETSGGLLTSLNKTRARPASRRPSTRKARVENYRKACTDETDDVPGEKPMTIADMLKNAETGLLRRKSLVFDEDDDDDEPKKVEEVKVEPKIKPEVKNTAFSDELFKKVTKKGAKKVEDTSNNIKADVEAQKNEDKISKQVENSLNVELPKPPKKVQDPLFVSNPFEANAEVQKIEKEVIKAPLIEEKQVQNPLMVSSVEPPKLSKKVVEVKGKPDERPKFVRAEMPKIETKVETSKVELPKAEITKDVEPKDDPLQAEEKVVPVIENKKKSSPNRKPILFEEPPKPLKAKNPVIDSFFDDDDDDDDDFLSTIKVKPQAPSKEPPKPPQDTPAIHPNPISSQKISKIQAPTSIFDDDDDDLFSAPALVKAATQGAVAKEASSTKGAASTQAAVTKAVTTKVETTKATTTTTKAPAPSSLFNDSDDDDLFSSAAKIPPPVEVAKAVQKPKSLFGDDDSDDDDDMFSTKVVKQPAKAKQQVKMPQASLFGTDDDDDDLFGGGGAVKTTIKKTVNPVPTKTTTTVKKTSVISNDPLADLLNQ